MVIDHNPCHTESRNLEEQYVFFEVVVFRGVDAAMSQTRMMFHAFRRSLLLQTIASANRVSRQGNHIAVAHETLLLTQADGRSTVPSWLCISEDALRDDYR